jgi:hypothetical protein
LHQAADSSLWAEGIKYDPDNDGTYFASLGVHEHWNNEIDKQYSRNLGTGDGIELLEVKNYTYVQNENIIPATFQLSQNYPNPFNPSTTITFSIPKAGHVTLKVFDILGNEVATLFDGFKTPQTYSIKFDGVGLPSGVYLYSLNALGENQVRKMVLAK